MKVDVMGLRGLVKNLLSSVKLYEDSLLNYNYEMNVIAGNWEDGKSVPFFEVMSDIKKNSSMVFYDVLDIVKIYEYIALKYESIGNKIHVNFDSYSLVFDKCQYLMKEIDSLILEYDKIDLSDVDIVCASYIRSERIALVKERDMIEHILNEDKEFLDNIRDSEFTIRNKENDIDLFVLPDMDGCFNIKSVSALDVRCNVDAVNESISKLELYKKDEDLVISDLKKYFRECGRYYSSYKKGSLSGLVTMLLKNMDRISYLHFEAINFVRDNANHYVENSVKMKNEFLKIRDGSIE